MSVHLAKSTNILTNMIDAHAGSRLIEVLNLNPYNL